MNHCLLACRSDCNCAYILCTHVEAILIDRISDPMNSETNAFTRGVQRSIEASGGLQSYRKHVLQHLQLKAVIKVLWMAIKHSPATIQRPTGEPLLASAAVGVSPHLAQPLCHRRGHTGGGGVASPPPLPPHPHTHPQATVYDDAHMGDNLAIVVHFTNKATQHAPGGVRWWAIIIHRALLVTLAHHRN